ncbi:MAG: hypothetical protein RJA19_714 [Bacteroidota bacterium]
MNANAQRAETHFDAVVVGGGIVGAATFYQVQRRHPDWRVLLVEKEAGLAHHQTGNNSGVIHSGLYYKPGSLKAQNCVKGRRELVAFAREHQVPHDVCGKVVVAVDASEVPRLEKIYQTGLENQIEGLERISAAQLREIEPHCAGIDALYVPCTGIIDFRTATERMAQVACGLQPRSGVLLEREVVDIAREGGETRLRVRRTPRLSATPGIVHGHRPSATFSVPDALAAAESITCRHLVVCGGLQADRLARKDGVDLSERVVGFRGDYYELEPHAMHKVRNLIYPVPNPDFPFLGVHFTRMVHGGVECGPNAVFSFKREGYGKTDFDLRDTWEALTYGGTWKLFMQNMRFGIDEYRRAFSKALFLRTLQRLVPSLTPEDITPGRAGVRALLLAQDGDTRDDFRIFAAGENIHVLNAPSPAATAALAIGDYVAERVG